MNSWKSLKRERKEENEGGYKEKDGKKDILVKKKGEEPFKDSTTLHNSGLPSSIWLNHTYNNMHQLKENILKSPSSPSTKIPHQQKTDTL